MHRQLFLTLKINTIKTRKVRKKDIENNNHESKKHRDSRNKRRGDPRRIWQECMAQQNITRKKIFLAIVTKKEYAQMINIIKKKMRGRRPGDNDDNRLSFTSSVHHFPRRLKSLKKSGFEMITFFTQLFVYRCFKADTKKLTGNLGGWNYTLTHADVISGSVPDVLSDSIFSHFLLSSYSSRQWRQGTQ